MGGQNDAHAGSLRITDAQFRAFVQRHQHLEAAGIVLTPETNDDMTGSYGMIDPPGRFFSNEDGRHRYSCSILEFGVVAAFHEISFSHEKSQQRSTTSEPKHAA